jgi:hypothetical protein
VPDCWVPPVGVCDRYARAGGMDGLGRAVEFRSGPNTHARPSYACLPFSILFSFIFPFFSISKFKFEVLILEIFIYIYYLFIHILYLFLLSTFLEFPLNLKFPFRY